MAQVYAAAAAALDVDLDALNLEGACVVGRSLRWFHRGLPSAGLPSGSVDLDLDAVWSAALGEVDAADLRVTRPRHYDLGSVDGVGLAITDVVALPGGDLLACAAAEDSPNPRDDGPVTATALARLRGDRVDAVVRLPDLDGKILKVEGLMVLDADETSGDVVRRHRRRRPRRGVLGGHPPRTPLTAAAYSNSGRRWSLRNMPCGSSSRRSATKSSARG